MLDSVLIANRGEIACRVIRTARRLGMRTIAVYSEADRNALHVRLADEAVAIGPAPARESYLNIPAIIGAARASGARCIHPGYGFLSENAAFARACAEAGVVFVGPPESSILRMGSKSEARRLMAAAGVPVLPGYDGEEQAPAQLLSEAAAHGFPAAHQAHGGRRREGHAHRARRGGLRRGARRRATRGRQVLRRRPGAAGAIRRDGPARRDPGICGRAMATPCTCSSAIARCSGVTRR